MSRDNMLWRKIFNEVEKLIESEERTCVRFKKDKHVSVSITVGVSVWLGTQRGLYKIDKLKKDRVKLLEKLPNWQWDMSEFKKHPLKEDS